MNKGPLTNDVNKFLVKIDFPASLVQMTSTSFWSKLTQSVFSTFSTTTTPTPEKDTCVHDTKKCICEYVHDTKTIKQVQCRLRCLHSKPTNHIREFKITNYTIGKRNVTLWKEAPYKTT